MDGTSAGGPAKRGSSQEEEIDIPSGRKVNPLYKVGVLDWTTFARTPMIFLFIALRAS